MSLSLEQRITRIEDTEQIKVLIAAFARGADARCDPALLRPLFTDDAVFDVDRFGRLEGGAEIARQMHENVDLGFHWTLHFLVSPVVEIQEDLRSARCFFYLWEAASHRRRDGEDVAYWIGGWYEADCLKGGDDRWRFRHLRLDVRLMSPNSDGWQAVPDSFDALG